MDRDFEKLIIEAKKLALKKELSKYAVIGQVGSALLTKAGNIYTGISMEAKCNLGNCGEHAAIAEMLKNNESEIDKIVAYSAKGQIYAPCGRCRELIRMVNEKNLETKIPSVTKTDIVLPKIGAYDTTITWSSSNEESINSGKVKRSEEDVTVALIATITKGESTLTKKFNVLVKGVLQEVGEEPTYKYDFESIEDDSIINSGSKGTSAKLMGSSIVTDDDERGNVLEIINEKDAKKVNYLALPTDTFEGITEEGYTISMWVNIDKNDPNYFEHSALFEGSMTNEDGTPNYPITRISANLYGRINANGAWSDATEITKPLEGNKWEYVTYTVSPKGIVVYVDGNEVGRQDKDIAALALKNGENIK